MITERELRETIDDRINAALDDQDVRNREYFDERMDEMKAMMKSAFVEGDPVEHRKYHELLVKHITARTKLIEDVRNKTFAGLVWLGLLWFGTALVEYAKARMLGVI